MKTKLLWRDPTGLAVVTENWFTVVYEGPIADLDDLEGLHEVHAEHVQAIKSLCRLAGMIEPDARGADEDLIDYHMRVVANCLAFMQVSC